MSSESSGPLTRGRAIQHLLRSLVKHGLSRILRAYNRGVVGLVGPGPRRNVKILELFDHDGSSLIRYFVVGLSLLVQVPVLDGQISATIVQLLYILVKIKF